MKSNADSDSDRVDGDGSEDTQVICSSSQNDALNEDFNGYNNLYNRCTVGLNIGYVPYALHPEGQTQLKEQQPQLKKQKTVLQIQQPVEQVEGLHAANANSTIDFLLQSYIGDKSIFSSM